jgi:hypothetical protein
MKSSLLKRKRLRTASKLALAQLNEISPLLSSGPPNPQHSSVSFATVKSLENYRTYKNKDFYSLPQAYKKNWIAFQVS